MSVSVYVDPCAENVYRFEFDGTWSWDELIAEIKHTIEVGNRNARNDVIVYMPQGNYLPSGALTRYVEISRLTPSNEGYIIITGARTLVNATIETFRRVAGLGNQWRTAKTLEDARQMILEARAES